MIRAAVLLTASLVSVQMPGTGSCLPLSIVEGSLKRTFGEVLDYAGVLGSGYSMMLVYISEAPPYTFSVVELYPNGVACLRWNGDGWRDAHEEIDG